MIAVTHLPTPNVAWTPLMPSLILIGAALIILMVKSVTRQRLTAAWPTVLIASAATVASAWSLIIQTRSIDRNAPAQSFGAWWSPTTLRCSPLS